MSEEKEQILITMACEDLDGPAAPGSSILTCDWCQRLVWVSPASPYWTQRVQICCTRCQRELPPEQDDPFLEPTEEQRQEIARGTGLYGDALDRLIKYAQNYYRRRGHG